MEFRYTEKIGYIIAVVSIVAPFYVSIQEQVFGNDSYIMIMGPFWQLVLHGSEISNFAMHPFVLLLYLPFWGLGLYIAKIAFDEAKVQEKTRYEYMYRVVKVLLLHMLILIYFALMNTGIPEPLRIPIPAAGLLALLLTPVIIKGQEKIWENQDAFTEEVISEE